jgi:hypothetical protein
MRRWSGGNDGLEFPIGKFPLKRRLSQQRMALEMLASIPNGTVEEQLVHGHNFTCRMLATLVRAGLAMAQREVIKAGVRTIEVRCIAITDAGRRAIEG